MVRHPRKHSSGSTQVLDVGSKTGAAALLFAALGARTVVALEEDWRACAAVGVLAEALALGAVVEPLCASLYDVGVLGPEGADPAPAQGESLAPAPQAQRHGEARGQGHGERSLSQLRSS